MVRWGQQWHRYCALPPPAGLVHPTLSLSLPDAFTCSGKLASLGRGQLRNGSQDVLRRGLGPGWGGSGPVLPGHTAWKQFLWTQSPPAPPAVYLRGPQPVGGRGGFLGLLGPEGGPSRPVGTALPRPPAQPASAAPRQARRALEWWVLASPALLGTGPSLSSSRIDPQIGPRHRHLA